MIERSEFIGRKIRIIKSGAKALDGKEGIVIDETKMTILVNIDGKTKALLKESLVFEVGGKRIDGKTISLRPEERIKRTKKG